MSKTHLPPDIVRRYSTALGVMVDRNADWSSRERLWEIAAHVFGRNMWQGSIDIISFRLGAFAILFEHLRNLRGEQWPVSAILPMAGMTREQWEKARKS